MLYRKGVLDDTDQILVLGREMHKESAFASLDWSDQKAANLFTTCVTKANYCCFVVEKDGVLKGMIAVRLANTFLDMIKY